jgi:uncharacterized protein
MSETNHRLAQGKRKENKMDKQYVGCKAKSFELRNLLYYFMVVFGLQVLSNGLLIAGIIKVPTSEGLAALAAGPGIILVFLAAWGPTLVAFVITGITEGITGVRGLWKRFWNRNIHFKWLLVILFFCSGVRLVANLVSRLVDGQAYPILNLPDPPWMVLTAFLSAFVANGLTEEFGWRGYVLPRFQAKWNALTSSLLLGIIWVSWHIPLFFTPGEPLYGQNFWRWAPYILLMTIVYTWIFNNTKGSVLAAALLHASSNTAIIVLTSLWHYYIVLGLTVLLIVLIYGPKDLVRNAVEKPAEEGTPLDEQLTEETLSL